jgi:hypothetical protein
MQTHHQNFLLALFWVILLTLFTSKVWAGPFSYTYVADTLPEGKSDVYQYTTARLEKRYGDYTNLQFRDVVEYGITDRLQFAMYATSQYIDAYQDLNGHKTGGSWVPATVNPNSRYTSFNFASVSTEWEYRFTSAKHDQWGTAVVVVPTIGPRQRAIEPRFVLQKNLLDDKLVLAGNVSWAWNWYDNGIEWTPTMCLTVMAAAGYHVDKHWLVGAEYRQTSDFSTLSTHDIQNVVFALGPCIRYDDDNKWWVKFTALPQLPIAGAMNDSAQSNMVDGTMYGGSHEKLEMRMQVGFKF